MGTPIINRIKIFAYPAFTLAFIISICLSAYVARADEPSPKPKPKEAALNSLKQKMQDRRERKQELAQKMEQLENKLETLRRKLIEISEDIQKQEASLNDIEARLADLRKQRDNLETQLYNDRKRLSGLVLALQRIERIPPSAMIARPGSPLQTAQSAMLLEASLSGVHTRAQQVRARMDKLKQLKTTILSKKRELDETAEKRREKQRKMRALVAERRSVYSRTRRQHKQEEKALSRIASRAENMKQFIKKLAEKNRKQRQKQRKQQVNRKQSDSSADLRPEDTYMPESKIKIHNPGKTRLPATGKIDINYGQENHIGAKSKGIHLQARPGALIVAPISGVVRYKGSFKNFGKLIIIEHDKNYHSLIAGLDKIDTLVGQNVAAGEPIGQMAESTETNSRLYYELRHEGHPVNPARRIAEL